MNDAIMDLCRLFFATGLAVSLAFIVGIAVGFVIRSYVGRQKQ